MKKIILIMITLMITINLFASEKIKFKEKIDEFDGTKHISTDTKRISINETDYIKMNLGILSKNKKSRIFMTIIYVGKDSIFIESGKSLEVLLKDKKELVELYTDDGSFDCRSVMNSGKIIEVATYNYDKEKYNKIFSSKKIKCRLNGSQSNKIFEIPNENLAHYKLFVNKFCK